MKKKFTEENRKLKQMVAELSGGNHMLLRQRTGARVESPGPVRLREPDGHGVFQAEEADGQAFAESFLGSLRDEFLDVNRFLSLEDAGDRIEALRTDRNEYRPHSPLGGRAPG